MLSLSSVGFAPMDDEHYRHPTVRFIDLVDHLPIANPIPKIAFQWAFEFF